MMTIHVLPHELDKMQVSVNGVLQTVRPGGLDMMLRSADEGGEEVEVNRGEAPEGKKPYEADNFDGTTYLQALVFDDETGALLVVLESYNVRRDRLRAEAAEAGRLKAAPTDENALEF
jgi:hypothetical protein